MYPAENASFAQSPRSVFVNDEVRRPAFVSYFGLRENPFRTTSDPRYLLLTNQAREALDGLISGIHARAGLLVLTGEVGAGKTVLLNTLLDALRQRDIPRAFIFNSHLETDDLLEMAMFNFGIPPDPRASTKPAVRMQQWLFECYRAKSNPVLIVDEAQGLKIEVLEALRMLLNLEMGGEKLLQIVLAGQPEFDAKINLPELRQLRQRIALRYRLGPLALDETCLYIEHRLRVAGGTVENIFEPETLAALHYYARGTPRVVNALCEQALMKACAERQRPIPPKTVEEIAFQFQVDGHKPVGMPAQLGDLMMMNAIAARSRRANGRIAGSASADSTIAALPPEQKPDEAHFDAPAPLPEPMPLPVAGTLDSGQIPVSSVPAAASSSASLNPATVNLLIDLHAAPRLELTTPASPKEPPPDPIDLLIGATSSPSIAPKPPKAMAASAPAPGKPAFDSGAPIARSSPAMRTPKAAAAIPSPSAFAHLPAKAQLSLAASLSSIERAATNWLRWLREPIGSSRGTSRGKSR